MKINELEIFNEMPFLFWVKDKEGRYLWGNRTICQLAGEDVAGKTDNELTWKDNAPTLQKDDVAVFSSGKPSFIHEYIDKSNEGKAALNVCKWVGDLDGNQCCFGISFVIP